MERSANIGLVALLTLVLVTVVPAGSDESTAAQPGTAPGAGVLQGRAVPGTVWYQGFLADVDTGDPINDTVEIVAELFDAAVDGTGLWGPETHGGISVVEGWFNIELGSIVSPLPTFDSPPYYLQLTINGEPFGSRMKLASTPTAIHAGAADGGGGGIAGGGDPGYIPVFTTGSEVSNSVMLQTSGRISIDSSTSDAKLRVENAGDLPVLKLVNTSSGVGFDMLTLTRNQDIAAGDGMISMQMGSGSDTAAYFLACSGPALSRSGFAIYADGDISTEGTIVVDTDDFTGIDVVTRAGDMYGAAISAVCQAMDVSCTGVEGNAGSDGYGTGGQFTGGSVGVRGTVVGGQSMSYFGSYGEAYINDASGWGHGVYGAASGSGSCYGVHGYAYGTAENYGVYGSAYLGTTNWAGYFDGDVHSTGTITSAKAGFEIDHPGDPSNAYLRHAYVASPEMKTVTDGMTVLDATGSATVSLPDWFDTLNSDVRYQLTPIGGAAPDLHIARKISGNMFVISGGEPGMEVCWMVTGVRKDRAALTEPLTVEADKPLNARGKYVSPAAFGATREMGIGHREIKRPPQGQ